MEGKIIKQQLKQEYQRGLNEGYKKAREELLNPEKCNCNPSQRELVETVNNKCLDCLRPLK